MRKGEKALKYADLLWGDEKVRRITLEDLCIMWNLSRLLKEGELSFGMRVHSYRDRFRLSQTKKATLFYAYKVFHD
ncbi:hypothetical protein [Thermocrinis sp.]|jgi:hypothetical protein|uniref:hypothetical protein n=1 Tax=Thermocrinis sp. TaxID=2024383 RepID=UPI003C056287